MKKFKAFETIKKHKKIAGVGALSAVLVAGSSMAFFTDGDEKNNELTVGNVTIDFSEPNWNPNRDDDNDGVPDKDEAIPEQEIPKDPQITNTGKNRAFVFMKVTVPYRKIVVTDDAGKKQPLADTELWTYDVTPGWIEIKNPDTKYDGGVDDDTAEGSGTGLALKDTEKQTVTHLYAYASPDAMTPLDAPTPKGANTTTPPLFKWIKFANAVEDQGLENTRQDVLIKAYAIQSTNVNDEKTALDGNNADGKVKPEQVWAVFTTQDTAKTNDKGEEDDQDKAKKSQY